MKNPFFILITVILLSMIGYGVVHGASTATILRTPQQMSGMKMAPLSPSNAVGGPFQLIDQNGHEVTEKNFANVYKLVYFGFTNCPEQCPLTLRNLSQALTKLGDQGKQVRILFITTDPARDTPGALKTYLSSFPPGIVGLTGSQKQIDTVEKEYKVYAEKHIDPAMNGYMMDHSAAIYFMDPKDEMLTLFGPDDTADNITAGMTKALSAR